MEVKDEEFEDALQVWYEQLNAVAKQVENSCLAFNLPVPVTMEFEYEGEKKEIGVVRLTQGWGLGVRFPDRWKHFSECKFALKIAVLKQVPELRKKLRVEAEKLLPELFKIAQDLKGLL